MKIKYMGTAAAEGIPALFCRCRVCENARKAGGRDKRTRSQALINEDLLIDFPQDTYMHYQTYNFDLPGICNLLVTHCHTDHFYPMDLEMRCEAFAHPCPPVMHIYGTEEVRRQFEQTLPENSDARQNYTIAVPALFQTIPVGRYQVTPLLAKHDPNQECRFYEIGQDGKWMLYAHDTGFFPPETWQYLRSCGHVFHMVSLDGNCMKHADGGYHMGLADDIEVKRELEKIGAVNDRTIFVLNHFSHNGEWTHAELQQHANPHGFLCSYDGMEVEF